MFLHIMQVMAYIIVTPSEWGALSGVGFSVKPIKY